MEKPPLLSKPTSRFEETKMARLLFWPFKPTALLVKVSIIVNIFFGLILLAAVGFWAFERIHLRNALEIHNVLEQRTAAYKNATTLVLRDGKTLHKPLSMPQYIANIEQINYSKCPTDFRLAWIDYVHACEAEKQASTLSADVIAVIELLHSLDPSGLKNKQDADSRLQQAGFNLERVAVRYGFTFTNSQ
jgi:hypothetical protein